MGKKDRSRSKVSSSSGGNSYYIDVMHDVIAKKSHYIDLPSEMIMTQPPYGSTHFLSYDSIGWHPIGILNSDTNELLNDKNIKLQMEIEIELPDGSIRKNDPNSLVSNIAEKQYWFRPILFHVPGKYTFRFSITKNASAMDLVVDTLEWKGVCIAPDDDDDDDQPKSKKQKLQKSKKSKSKKDDDDDDDDEYEDDFADLEDEEVCVTKPKNKTITSGVLLPYPKNANLKKKFRLKREGTMGSIDILGPCLELKLPPSLVIALLDDRNSVQLTSTEVVNDIKHVNSDPTVNDLLFRCQKKIDKVILDNESYINDIRYGFEYAFESCTLYSSERKKFRKIIDKCRSNKTLFGDVFGAVYLLRFLVIFALNADLGSDNDNDNVTSSSTTTIDDIQLTSEVNEITNTNSNGHSSQKRRNAATTKKIKEVFYKMQEVVSLIIKEIDDDAHYLF